MGYSIGVPWRADTLPHLLHVLRQVLPQRVFQRRVQLRDILSLPQQLVRLYGLRRLLLQKDPPADQQGLPGMQKVGAVRAGEVKNRNETMPWCVQEGLINTTIHT